MKTAGGGTGTTQTASGGNNNMENKSDTNLKFDAKGWYKEGENNQREYLSEEERKILDI